MKPRLLVATCLLFACAAYANPGLHGIWIYSSITDGSETLPIHKGDQIEFRKDRLTWRWLGKDQTHRYQLLEVDGHSAFIAYTDNRAKYKGIYKFAGDQLIICDRHADEGFPSQFSAKEGTLIVLDRAKPAP